MDWNNKKEIEGINSDLGNISFQDQCVFVTGGAGFLGSWVCDVLISQGAELSAWTTSPAGFCPTYRIFSMPMASDS